MQPYLDDANAQPGGDSATGVAPVAHIGRTLLRILGGGWWWLRQVSGDADYENYLRRMARDSGAAISAEEFYLRELRRKHSKINRCC